jgi:hypothetical protein
MLLDEPIHLSLLMEYPKLLIISEQVVVLSYLSVLMSQYDHDQMWLL